MAAGFIDYLRGLLGLWSGETYTPPTLPSLACLNMVDLPVTLIDIGDSSVTVLTISDEACS